MSVIEYIGMRYIPKFSTPIEWNINNTYEYFTIVQYNGDTYVSMKDVPSNIDISNTEYWLRSASFNAQYENLRSGIITLRNQINDVNNNINEINNDIDELDNKLNNIIDSITPIETNLLANTTQQTVGTFYYNDFTKQIYVYVPIAEQTSELWGDAIGVESFRIECPNQIKSKAFFQSTNYCFLRHNMNSNYISIVKNPDAQVTDDVIFNITLFI